jgi:TetR/AcrR family transcriptional regulator
MAVAIRSFSQLGYEGTTTAGVARAAGVTQPLIHHHFGSKEGLWRAAMAELFSGVGTFAVPSDASPTEQILAAAEQFVRFAAARPEVTRVITREGASPSPRLTYLIDEYVREPFREIVGAIRAGQRAGVIAAHLRPDLLLFLLLGAGSHFFDVTAFARESLGVDATAARNREDFVCLIREVLQHGVFRSARKPI